MSEFPLGSNPGTQLVTQNKVFGADNRPILHLPAVLSKACERFVHNQFSSYLININVQ